MRLNFLFLVILFLLAVGLSNCSTDCEPKFAACSETPPTNEACQAAFNRWFFIADENRCEQIAYSGCSQKGFASQQECEACKCN